jgi:hypothetical protein
MAQELIGQIALLQIQTASLKVGQGSERYYDPAGIVQVPQLRLSPYGVLGLVDGHEQIDIHHRDHPATKYRQRDQNGISLGFTSHYREMREHFGDHLYDGIAGENVVIRCDTHMSLEDLGEQVEVITADGRSILISVAQVAAPCREFSIFAANQGAELAAEDLKKALQFLNDGQRGFYAALASNADDAVLHVGDKVYRYQP